MIDFLATDIDELLEKADGRTVNFGGRETVLHTRGLAIETIDMIARELFPRVTQGL